MSDIFTLELRNPEQYRRETRKSNLIIMGTFAVLAMTLSTLSISIFGNPDGDNLRWNLAGIIAGIIVTTALFKLHFWHKPWMDSARYGWRLKRNLMRVTNILHAVKDGVEQNDPTALRTMRFYHLGLEQMYRLENNESALADLLPESRTHLERLETCQIDPDQNALDHIWVDQLKSAYKKKS